MQNQRNVALSSSNRNLTKEKSTENLEGRASSANLLPMKQRAFSSTGRTANAFNKLQEMQELEQIRSGLLRFEDRMKRASERREKAQNSVKQQMYNQTNRVNEKLLFKTQKQENDYHTRFEQNVLDRQKIEEKKKKRAEELVQLAEFDHEKKQEKIMGVMARQQNNKNQ